MIQSNKRSSHARALKKKEKWLILRDPWSGLPNEDYAYRQKQKGRQPRRARKLGLQALTPHEFPRNLETAQHPGAGA